MSSSSTHLTPLWRSVIVVTPETLRNARSTIEAADPGIYETSAWTRLSWIPEELVSVMREIQTVPHTQSRIRAWTRRYWQILSHSVKLVPENEVQEALHTVFERSHDTCSAYLFDLDLTFEVRARPIIELDAGTSMFRARTPIGKIHQSVPRPVFWCWTALAALYDAAECYLAAPLRSHDDTFAARRPCMEDIPNLDCLVRAASALV